jgi:hypothetical protein
MLCRLFQEWLSAFEAVQTAGEEELAPLQNAMMALETELAATPAEGLEGLVLKLGLHCFLSEHADGGTSAQSDSAYRDLVRLTGRDPALEMTARYYEHRLADPVRP